MADGKKRGAAILLSYAHDLFLNLRDDKEGINAPLQWTVFAGAIEAGETADQAIARELREEIGSQLQLEHLGSTPANDWYVATLNGQQVANIKRGEGCGHGFFSFEALKALAKVEGKGGLGGAIKRFMQNAPNEIEAFLASGKIPDLERLNTSAASAAA